MKEPITIVRGNDFYLNVVVSRTLEDGTVEPYDLSDAYNVALKLVTASGRYAEFPCTVAGNIVSAKILSYKLGLTTYGVEITFMNDKLAKRSYECGLLKIVNCECQTNETTTSDNKYYDINLEVVTDVESVQIGKVTPVHVDDELSTESEFPVQNKVITTKINEIDATLEEKADKSELPDLSLYTTKSQLEEALTPYATTEYVDDELANIDLTDYYTKSEIDTTLTSYGTSLDKTLSATLGTGFSLSVDLKNSSSDRLSRISIPAFSILSQNSDPGWNIVPSTETIGLVTKSGLTYILNNMSSTATAVAAISDDYVTSTSLNTTLNDYATISSLDDYVTSTSLNTTLSDYATISSLDDYVTDTELSTSLNPITSDISSLDTRVTTLENNPQVPSNVVTSDDGNEIICLTQAEYDALEQAQTLDPDVFYYITDATSNYVTNSSLSTTLDDYALLTDIPTVPTATSDLTNDSGFITLSDIPTIPTATSDLTNDSGFITLSDIPTIPTATSDLTNDSGFITINDIPQSSGVSEEDWDNSNEAIAQELTNNRLEHFSINDNFNNYYTKTEADGRYATTSWANSRFVTQAEDINRQQAIAAAFASLVQSTSVHNIWTGSQNDYDLITTPDINTLYIII